MQKIKNKQQWEIQESSVNLHYFTCTLHSDTLNEKVKSTHDFQDSYKHVKVGNISMRNRKQQLDPFVLLPSGTSLALLLFRAHDIF